jgi:hypothetical protein
MPATLLLAGVTIAAASAASGTERPRGTAQDPATRACKDLGEIFRLARGAEGAGADLFVGICTPLTPEQRRPAYERPICALSSLSREAQVGRRGLSLVPRPKPDEPPKPVESKAVSDPGVEPSPRPGPERAALACAGDANLEEHAQTASQFLGEGHAKERDGPVREA